MKSLSIIIPTKNRQRYCIATVKQIVRLKLDNIEIVIQDNSDEPGLKSELASIPINNVVYNYHGGELSFVDNFSEAVSLAKGEYLCVIGDDDGILPNIVDVVEFARENNYDSIIPGLNSCYIWPSDSPFLKGGEDGYLTVAFVKSKYRDVNIHDALNRLLKQAGQNYQSLDLPRLYHGVVKREIIQNVYKRTGKYFGGLTPDIYMTIALCFVCKKVSRVYFPVTVSGVCPRSGSSDSATGKHTGELKHAPHFNGHISYQWDDKVPAIYSVESIWAETVLHALNDFDAEDLIREFRIDVLDGICLARYPQFREQIMTHAQKYKIRRINLFYQCGKSLIMPFVHKVIQRVFRMPRSVFKYPNVSDINDACRITTKILNGKIRSYK